MGDYLPINGLIQICTAVAAMLVIAILWRFRKAIEVKYLIYLEITVAIWATCYAFEFFSSDLQIKFFWSKLAYLGIAFLPPCYFFFTTAFSQKNKLINKRNKILLSIIPIVTIILVFTNQYHHLVWEATPVSAESKMIDYVHGLWFWVFYTYTILLSASGIYNLFSSVYKFTSYYKSQVVMLLIGSLVPVLANVIYVSKINPYLNFDWTTVSFIFSGLIIILGVYRFKMFELVPLAKKKLLDTMSEAVVVVNAKGYIEDINPASSEIFGINGKDVIECPIQEVFKNYEQIIAAFNKQEDSSIEITIGDKEEAKYYQVKASALFTRNVVFSGKLFVVNDVTSIRRAEIELRNINKKLVSEIEKNEKLIDDLDAFAHTVAHDLKNSLGSIYSSSQLIIDYIDEEDIEFVKSISLLVKDASMKSIQVTNELLKMATSGNQDIEKKPVKMESVFKQAKKQLSAVIIQNDAQISVPTDWHSALGYEPWIEEVWVNYISNAIKYGGTPPVISVGSEKIDNQKIKFWIKDNGDGIAIEHQNKLFHKHTRLAPEKAGGYGLGLSIVKSIVEKLEGTIGLESEGVQGKGATFYFVLPAN